MIRNITVDIWAGKLNRLGVEVIPYARLYGADGDTAYFHHMANGEPIVCEGMDTLVLAQGHQPAIALEDSLRGSGLEIHLVGDCLSPRTAEEAIYEGYGPGGVAVLVEVLTDNKNRAVADVRHLFAKRGGNLGEPGSVAWIFEKKGLILVEKDKADEETLMSIALEANAEDIQEQESEWEVYTVPESFEDVKSALHANSIPVLNDEVTRFPGNRVSLMDEKQPSQLLILMVALGQTSHTQNPALTSDMPTQTGEQ